MAVVLLSVLRPGRLPLWPVDLPAAALVVAGAALLFVNAMLRHDDGISFFSVTKLAPLESLVVLALGWLALAAVDPKARLWLSATISTYLLISIVATIPALADDVLATILFPSLVGNLLAAAGMAVAARRRISPTGAGQPHDPKVVRWFELHRWPTVVGLGVGALLLLLVNLGGLDADLRLWYNSQFGSPDLERHQADGTLAAALVALVGAALAWRRGPLGAYAQGAAAGAAALFATAGVVILGGRISYDDTVYVWSISLLTAGLMLVLVLVGAGLLSRQAYRRADRATTWVLAAGFVWLMVTQLLSDESGPSAATYTRGLSLLLPVVAAALVLAGTATANRVIVGAAASYLLLFAIAALYPINAGQAPRVLHCRIGWPPGARCCPPDGHCARQAGGQPRIAPSVAPLMNWRAKMVKMTISGIIAISAPVITML